jgi:antitoxin (DNA-binding transcriptional repressor) of toxin-antitoxin stability system
VYAKKQIIRVHEASDHQRHRRTAQLPDLVNRVWHRGEEFLIAKGGVPVARLGPVGPPRPVGTVRDMVGLVERLGADPGFADQVDEIVARDNRATRTENPWGR